MKDHTQTNQPVAPEKGTGEKKSRKGIGGRKPKKAEEKSSYKVGSFKLNKTDKEKYDRLFASSGLVNQSEFFRRVMFGEAIKLYYSDKNTSLIYKELLGIKNEINAIGRLYNTVVARVNAVSTDQSLYGSLQELKGLHGQVLSLMEQLGGEVEALKGAVEEREKGRVDTK